VVIAPIDQHNLDVGVPQRMRRRKPRKAGADDHDTFPRGTRCIGNGCFFDGVGFFRYGAH
jgi:hypothetical protein